MRLTATHGVHSGMFEGGGPWIILCRGLQRAERGIRWLTARWASSRPMVLVAFSPLVRQSRDGDILNPWGCCASHSQLCIQKARLPHSSRRLVGFGTTRWLSDASSIMMISCYSLHQGHVANLNWNGCAQSTGCSTRSLCLSEALKPTAKFGASFFRCAFEIR